MEGETVDGERTTIDGARLIYFRREINKKGEQKIYQMRGVLKMGESENDFEHLIT